jgi:hypothetical protein
MALAVGTWLTLSRMRQAAAATEDSHTETKPEPRNGAVHAVLGDIHILARNTHGFIFAGGSFSIVDVAGARSTLLTRIKNDGSITGVYGDALNEQHGMTGQ